ncbi:hypothetical protein BHE74_00020077, partial [Ensete ventricosum]
LFSQQVFWRLKKICCISNGIPIYLETLQLEQETSASQMFGFFPWLSHSNIGGDFRHQQSRWDMSNNSFDESDVPSWFSTLPSLTSL